MSTRLRRPSVNTRPNADRHSNAGQRVIEFMFPNGNGGLMSLHTAPDGRPHIAVYMADPDVRVSYTPPSGRRLHVRRAALAGSHVVLSVKK